MAKLTGLILVILGFALLVGNFLFKAIFEKIPFVAGKPWIVLIAGIVLIFAGLVFMKGEGKKEAEVPVYDKKGKRIVGYRRIK